MSSSKSFTEFFRVDLEFNSLPQKETLSNSVKNSAYSVVKPPPKTKSHYKDNEL